MVVELVLVAFGGMAATIMLIISAAIKFGWLGCLHVVLTVCAVGVWFAAASLVDGEDDSRD